MNDELLITFTLLKQWLYPLGFASSLFFAARFLVQWLQSEKQGKSTTPKSFWHLSAIGNLLLMIHSLIQSQLPIAFVQSGHFVISIRNLDLTKPTPVSLKKVVLWFIFSFCFVLIWFFGQASLSNDWSLMSVPITAWSRGEVQEEWHYLGFVGIILFGSRFWIQWILAEKNHESRLGPLFWYLSLFGALLSALYFFYIRDLANLIPNLFGLIPYVRNLMLQKVEEREKACPLQP